MYRTYFITVTWPTAIYTLSLHDALPISAIRLSGHNEKTTMTEPVRPMTYSPRSEEHTSELQSPMYLVCRLLLEKKKEQEKQCDALHNGNHDIGAQVLQVSLIQTHKALVQ